MITIADELLSAAQVAVLDLLERHELEFDLHATAQKWIRLEELKQSLLRGPYVNQTPPDHRIRDAARVRAGGRCELCGGTTRQRCTCLDEIEGRRRIPLPDPRDTPTGWMMGEGYHPLWCEHMVPKTFYQHLGVRWDVIESEANIIYDHKDINGWKGTTCLTPDEIVSLWKVHQFGADTEHAPAVLLAAQLITTAPHYRIPVLEPVFLKTKTVGTIIRRRLDEYVEEESAKATIAAEQKALNEAYAALTPWRKDRWNTPHAKARRKVRAANKRRDGEPPGAF